MTIHALEGLAPQWFTPDGQGDDTSPTRFKIRPLNGSEYGEVADHIALDGGRFYIKEAGRRRALDLALIDWEHFTAGDTPLDFARSHFDRIPHPVRMAICSQIMEISSLTGEQEKN